MFNRKKKGAATPEEHLTKVVVQIQKDDGSFSTENDKEIGVKGHRVFTEAGELVHRSDEGPVMDGLFYFRIAGATHHIGAAGLDGDALPQVLLVHQPDNPHDSNAIQILTQKGGTMVGFVPAVLSPRMLPSLIPATQDGKPVRGTMGVVVKTFHRGNRVMGGEVLVVEYGYELQVTA